MISVSPFVEIRMKNNLSSPDEFVQAVLDQLNEIYLIELDSYLDNKDKCEFSPDLCCVKEYSFALIFSVLPYNYDKNKEVVAYFYPGRIDNNSVIERLIDHYINLMDSEYILIKVSYHIPCQHGIISNI